MAAACGYPTAAVLLACAPFLTLNSAVLKTRVAAVLIVLLVLACAGLGAGGWLAAPAPRDAPSAIDIGFAQSMSAHHQQAVLMALRMIDGKPTALAGFAQNLVVVQQFERGQMQGWLRLWNQTPKPVPDMQWLLLGQAAPEPALKQYLLDCGRAPGGMVGLASAAELDQLRQTQGRARDRLFLSLMLRHHAGALPMARFAAREARTAAVRELAQRIELDQAAEIGRMQNMIAALADAPDTENKER